MATYYFRNVGTNWGDAANWSLTDGGGATGAVPTATDDALFTANSGNCTVNASNRVCKTLNFTGYTNTITMTFNITVSGNITLASGMAVSGTGQLIVDTTSTLTSNGFNWSAGFTFSGTSQTFTLADAWTISGVLRLSSTTSCTINSNSITSSGNLTTTTAATTSGTTSISLTGGTWSNTSTGQLQNNLTINGNVTISGNIYYNTGTLTYTSGLALTTGSTLLIQAPTTFNTNIMLWNNISYSSTASTTLLSDLNIGGLYTTFGTFNGTFNINCYGGIRPNGNLAQGTGTTTLNLIAGTWSSSANYIQINTNIAGNITISGTVYFMTSTLTYVSGKPNVLSGSILSITTCTLINIDKINWRTIQINASATITMNKFFSGSALIPTRIQSSTTTNYNIAFQDGFEKITKFTKVSNCTVINRGQLLCITDKSNKGGNVGVRYINQMPNRVPLNSPTTANPLGYATSTYLLSDPNTILI